MKVLFFGDIVGRIGRQAIIKILPGLKKEFKPDLVLANAENIAHGKGVTVDTLKELMNAGINYFTSGNHFWSKKEEVEKVLTQSLPIIRPANYSDKFSGMGYIILDIGVNQRLPRLDRRVKAGSNRRESASILLINLIGRVFTKIEDFEVSCPFKKVDEILNKFPEIKIKIIDFHAEATSEKTALGYYLDGRVSLVVGTHTHVQTADEQILANGTAYLSDLGMVGAKDSIIGIEKQPIIDHFLSDKLYEPVEMEIPKKGIAIINGIFVEIDEKTGKATKIERIKRETII
ncbi:MAG: TIGR00282 family metallophosphoesterase [Patescibacteria group bacterium]